MGPHQYSGSVAPSLPLLQQSLFQYTPLPKRAATWNPLERKMGRSEFKVRKIGYSGIYFTDLLYNMMLIMSYLSNTFSHLIVCIQDLPKQDMGDCSYKQFPSPKPPSISSPPITSVRGYEQGPPPHPHKPSHSPQSLGSSSHNVHIDQTTFPFPNNKPSGQNLREHQVIPTHKVHPSGLRSPGSQAPLQQLSSSLTDRDCPIPTPAHPTAVPYSHPKFQPHPGLVPTTSPCSNSGTQAAAAQCNPHKPWRNQIKHDNQATVSVQHIKLKMSATFINLFIKITLILRLTILIFFSLGTGSLSPYSGRSGFLFISAATAE